MGLGGGWGFWCWNGPARLHKCVASSQQPAACPAQRLAMLMSRQTKASQAGRAGWSEVLRDRPAEQLTAQLAPMMLEPSRGSNATLYLTGVVGRRNGDGCQAVDAWRRTC